LLISKPRDARAAAKTATGKLSDEFDAADEAMTQMDDLIGQFQDNNAKFVGDYNNARTIVDASASHAGSGQTPTPTATPKTPTPTPTPAATPQAASAK
jgi:hypothetical protein